jgi:hypothetical protein
MGKPLLLEVEEGRAQDSCFGVPPDSALLVRVSQWGVVREGRVSKVHVEGRTNIGFPGTQSVGTLQVLDG